MVFSKALYFVLLLYTVNSGESRSLKSDFSLERRTRVVSYSTEVDNFFKKLFPTDPSCLNLAKKKNTRFSTYNQDIQKAVQLVNIYTQDCKAYVGSTGKPLYDTLNTNLRSGRPSPIWSEMAALLSKGLVLLGPKDFKSLYRGCHCAAVTLGKPFSFNQFASTTTKPGVAVQFLLAPKGKSFIHIKNARGTDIQPYSHFPGEQEILLDPNINLNVVQVETDIKRIRAEIKKILPTAVIPDNTVAKYVVLDGSRATKRTKDGFWSTCTCGNLNKF
ncbi:uncharacterized protein LOC114530967 [Dendronephthya gigantea]|uniref:uncharacterized protein LOC114530967 n=1 Tax=Dendronephthya gigantea TaxID=151771 RepID=UPI00106D67CB|nr:uncharacterized protein LOC114530967 [Dendronephthya gigantea]